MTVELGLYGRVHSGKTVVTGWNVKFNKKGELIKMTKKEQLKMVFRNEIVEAFDKVAPKHRKFTGSIGKIIDETTNILLKEVSIRTKLK